MPRLVVYCDSCECMSQCVYQCEFCSADLEKTPELMEAR